MRPVVVSGVGMIPFERRDEDSLVDMMAMAGLRAMDDAGLGDRPVDSVYVGNMASGLFNHQVSVASALVDRLSLMPAAADRVENGPASGGSAVKNGFLAVASGFNDVVLVIGGEKMREVIGPRATDIVACMTHPLAEYIYGVTLPAMAGMFTRLYMEKYGVTRKHLTEVAVKNQENGLLNPYAHIQKPLTMEDAMNEPIVSWPLKLCDCCPSSTGACAIVITSEDKAKTMAGPPAWIKGLSHVGDTLFIGDRLERGNVKRLIENLDVAAKKAYTMAGIKDPRNEIDVAEIYNPFTILEIIAYESFGFCKSGEGTKLTEQGIPAMDGELPVNPSGGTLCSNPISATGLYRVADAANQIRGKAGPIQIPDVTNALAHAAGGSGQFSFVMILSKNPN